MAHHVEDTTNLSPAERDFNNFILKGDSFSKIEIYRLAVEEYNKAAALHINKLLVEEKLAYCKKQMQFEKKVFMVLGAIALVIVGAVYLFR